MSFNWSNAAQNSVAYILGMVPEVGSLLSALTNIFWPQSEEDVWGEIKQQVEQLVNEKINQLVYTQVKEDLAGLNNVLTDYLLAIKSTDTTIITSQWIATKTVFDCSLPHFQSAGSEILLMPLFGQFVNLYLGLLRDGVRFGKSWGWDSNFQQEVAAALTDSITNFTAYANKFYQQGYHNIVQKTGTDYHNCQPFRSVNGYVRQMTLTLLDFVQMWPYFDISKYPNPISIYLNREVYSDPVGTCDNSGNINLPSSPTQPITQLTVWAWDRIDAVQLTYPTGGGPNGVTQTPRMGDQSGGTNQPPHGGIFNLSGNPITIASGVSGDVLSALNFTFSNGDSTGTLGGGGNEPGVEAFSFSFDSEILSSIHINGVSTYYGSADCAVFGFKYQQKQKINSDILRSLYITFPRSVSINDFAKLFSEDIVSSNELSEDWQTQREEYWDFLKQKSKSSKRLNEIN
jgi:hypothetical protein